MQRRCYVAATIIAKAVPEESSLQARDLFQDDKTTSCSLFQLPCHFADSSVIHDTSYPGKRYPRSSIFLQGHPRMAQCSPKTLLACHGGKEARAQKARATLDDGFELIQEKMQTKHYGHRNQVMLPEKAKHLLLQPDCSLGKTLPSRRSQTTFRILYLSYCQSEG